MISAEETSTWDNIKQYDEETQIITIINTFGLGRDIATIQLNTPLNYIVGAGYQKVAEFTINSFDNTYSDAFERMEFYDLKNNEEKFERDFDYKYLTTELIEVNDYKQICELSLNGTNICENVISGTHQEEREVWLDLDTSILLKGEITVGIFTEVQIGDYVEWIPTLFGKEIDEWASWITSLEANLRSYYRLDETIGNVVDYMDNNTGINNGSARGISGKIGNAFVFNSADKTNVILGDVITNYGTMSINLWFKENKTGGANSYLVSNQKAGANDDFDIVVNKVSGKLLIARSDVATGNHQIFSNLNMSDNQWHMATAVLNASGMFMFIDGVVQDDKDAFYEAVTNQGDWFMGGAWLVGDTSSSYIDEVGIWDRSLSQTEVTLLYNGGAGLSPRHSSYPTITLNSPTDGTITTNHLVTFNCTASDVINLINVSLIIDGFYNQTNSSGFNNSYYIFTTSLPFGSYNWTCEGCNDLNQCTNATAYNLSISKFTTINESYSTKISETDDTSFEINITAIEGIDSIGGFLVYNGSYYAATHSNTGGNNWTIKRDIDVPLLVGSGSTWENKSFFWQLTLFSGTSLTSITQNSTTHNQNVTRITFGEYAGTPSKAVNFTIYSESTLERLAADFNATFTYYLGSGTVNKTNYTTGNSVQFVEHFIYPNDTYIVHSQIDLAASGYEDRSYDFVAAEYIGNITTQPLYLLNSTGSSNIIIEVRNQGLIPMRNVLVNISRFYKSTGTYRAVETRLTDSNGQFVASLIENDVKYRFEFYSFGGVLLKTSPSIYVACRTTICVLSFTIEDIDDDFEDFESITLYDWSFSFNNVTNTFVYSWDDQTGQGARTRLEVTRNLLNGSVNVCNITSTAILSVLSCAVGDTRASYKGQVFRTPASGDDVGKQRRIAVLHIKVAEPYGIYGVEGLLWVFILLFTMIGVGTFNPVVGVSLYGIGFVVFGMIGIISMPISVFFANTVLCIIAIWAFKLK